MTDSSTVGDLTNWMQSQLKGSTVVAAARRRPDQVTSAPGLDQANIGISLSGIVGAATETQAARATRRCSADGGMDISSSGVAIHVDLTAGHDDDGRRERDQLQERRASPRRPRTASCA